MENIVTKIDISSYYRDYSNFPEVVSLDTKEDVATLIDTFEKSNLKAYNIVKILERNKKYIFVYDEKRSGYDFFEELNRLSSLGVNITGRNAKLLFNKEISRGYYVPSESDSVDIEASTGGLNRSVDEDAPTGFMGDDDLSELKSFSSQIVDRKLIYLKNGEELPINDSHGIIFGRSSSQSEYVIANNPKVSRRHARVYRDGNKCMVHDYDSANGTFVGGLRVFQDHDREIPVGGTLILANEEFKLV